MLSRRGAMRQPRREDFVSVPERRNPSGMGLLTGLVLGAGMWALILAVSMIKC